MLCFACDQNNFQSTLALEKSTTEDRSTGEYKYYPVSVPCEGNSWVVDNPEATKNIVGTNGIKNWDSSNVKIRTYFYAKKTGTIELGIKAKFDSPTTLKVTLGNSSKEVNFSKGYSFRNYSIGNFQVEHAGYQYVELEGISRNGNSFGEISDILLGNWSWSGNISYINSEWNYWGRRGPSCHMNYNKPANKDISWFYNEATVPVGMDPVGSYFMVNGFADGYFGMQVNSDTERRVLFSVWSEYDTQDPNQIPSEYTVQPLGYGKGVTIGEFGGEGSGAQSYLLFDWTPGTTYKFLLKGESKTVNSIDYSAYFYAPEIGSWKLIASFRRPFPSGSEKHLTGLYSFIENFETSMGDKTRQVNFSNQWVYNTQGTWQEITSATYSIDETAANGVRLDYNGGSNGNSFFLKNCGFFSNNQQNNSYHSRYPLGKYPNVDFSQLEKPTVPSLELLNKTGWNTIDYSSQEDQGGEGSTGWAVDVLDNDINTYWHSSWVSHTPSYPHYITVDMREVKNVDGIQFVQRQNLARTVKDIEIQISNDNYNWESLGSYVLQNSASNQNLDFPSKEKFRYFKIIAKSGYDGSEFAAIAEISPYISSN